MNMFKNVGQFEPDSLIASADFPILKEGIGLKANQGVLKRGTLIAKGNNGAGYIAGKDVSPVTTTIFGILTDDVDTGNEDSVTNIPATCYITGVFNKEAIQLHGEALISTYADDMRKLSLFTKSVQNY